MNLSLYLLNFPRLKTFNLFIFYLNISGRWTDVFVTTIYHHRTIGLSRAFDTFLRLRSYCSYTVYWKRVRSIAGSSRRYAMCCGGGGGFSEFNDGRSVRRLTEIRGVSRLYVWRRPEISTISSGRRLCVRWVADDGERFGTWRREWRPAVTGSGDEFLNWLRRKVSSRWGKWSRHQLTGVRRGEYD